MTLNLPRRYRVLLGLLAACLTSLASARDSDSPFVFNNVATVVAVGDVHGAIEPLRALLRGAGLIDAKDRWTGGTTHLVSLGDLIDRGDATRAVLDLMIRLDEEAEDAGGRVHVLLGNHELLNLTGDWRDVTAGDIASFAQPGDRDAASIRRQAFYRYGEYGDWLLRRPVLIKINDRLYTHGGLSSLLLDGPIDKANDVPMNLLRAMVVETETLVKAGVIEPDIKLLELQELVPRQDGEDPSLRRLRGMVDSPYFGDNGPLWYRGTTGCPATIEHDLTRAVLAHLDATSVVVGHSPTWNSDVRQAMGGKVWAIDTGMLSAVYGGKASALKIQQGLVTVLDATGQPVTADEETFAPFSVAQLDERMTALSNDYTVRLAPEQPEAERPRRYRGEKLVELVDAANSVAAVGWFRKMNKRDAAKEVAAWRLDRMLGLGMVPQTFRTKLGKASGVVAVTHSTVLTEQQRQEQERVYSNWCEHGSSYGAVTVFDALINQRDRNTYSLSYQHRLTAIRLTDHSDSFGGARKPPKSNAPAAISETLRERLAGLTLESLTQALGDAISKRELKALLKRRDVIVRWPGIAAQ